MLLLAAAGAAAQTTLEIIELHHRPAEELVPLVRPFVQPGGSLTGTGFRLIVRSSPANIEELRALVQEFDVGARRLRITVRQDAREHARESGAGIRGEIPLGESGRVRIGESGREGPSVELYDRRRREQAPMTHSVQATEGQWAAIATGITVPVRQPDRRHGGSRHEYVEVSSGFEVLPRVRGDAVQLTIRPRRSDVAERGIEVQRLDTTVSGQLGEWIELGGMASATQEARSGTLAEARREVRSDRTVQVKVEVWP